MTPYYSDDLVTLYHGDCRDVFEHVPTGPAAVLLTDPPYGIAYESGSRRRPGHARGCANDGDTSVRDRVIARWGDRRAIVFGSWKQAKPHGTRITLYWDTGGALGMGDLSLPWKSSTQEIYVLGKGFVGARVGNVLRFPAVQAVGRDHPFEKPVDLLQALIERAPNGEIVDPFAGVGSTLVAAKNLGRRALGIEIEERYCEIAAQRLSQNVMQFGGAA